MEVKVFGSKGVIWEPNWKHVKEFPEQYDESKLLNCKEARILIIGECGYCITEKLEGKIRNSNLDDLYSQINLTKIKRIGKHGKLKDIEIENCRICCEKHKHSKLKKKKKECSNWHLNDLHSSKKNRKNFNRN